MHNILKITQNNLFMRQKQTHRRREWIYGYQRGKGFGKHTLGVWNWQEKTALFKMDNQQGPIVQHRELCSVLCNNLNGKKILKRIVVVAQSLSRVWLLPTPWTAACQTSLSLTIFRSLLKLMSIKSVMPSIHLVLCHPLLLLPSIFPSIRVFSNESALRIRWPK